MKGTEKMSVKFKMIVGLFIVFIFVGSTLYGQNPATAVAETTSEVPALSQLHNVIYPLWHTAWPEKNVRMLVELLPEIEKLAIPVLDAKLPGILREKQTAWDKGIVELRNILTEYASSTVPLDSVRLLAAAEKLHMQFERLVRIVRPAMKEVDAFHSELYLLYHYYLPEWNLDAIKFSVTTLQTKMDLLNAVVLPDRLKKKSEAFTSARAELDASVKALAAVVAQGDKNVITEKVNAMHAKYEALDKVFN
jgi:hypothetical protein